MAWETRILKTVNSQSVANNTSNITFTFQARRTDYSVSGYNNYGTAYWRISVDGASSGNVYFNLNWKYGQNVWFTIASWTVTVTHNSEGYWGSNVDAYVNTGISPATLSKFDWYSPPNIARKTTVYGFTNTMGGIQGFELNRASTSFTHTLRYSFGNASGTIGVNLGTTAEWNPIPLSLANQIPNATQGTGKVYLDTYNGSTLIGTDTATFTLNVPTDIKPSVSGISVSDIGASKALGIYVQGISRLQLTAQASGSYGSWINSAKIVVDGQTIWSTSGTTANIRGSGNMTITATVTDSRGRSASNSRTINVQPYSSPSLSGYSATRQNPQSNVQVVSSGRVSSLTNGGAQKNSLTYKIKYKQKSSSSWETRTVSISGLSFSNNAQTLSNIDVTKSYDFQLCIADYFSETVYNLSVSTAKVILDVAKNGVGINKYYESGALDVNGPVKVAGGVTIDGMLSLGNYVNNSTKIRGGINVPDLRNITDTPGMFGSHSVNYSFNSFGNNCDGGRWKTVMSLNGWTNDTYNTHELAFDAHNSIVTPKLFHRMGNSVSGWTAWHRIANTADLTWDNVSGKPNIATTTQSNGWTCYEFPNGFKIQIYRATLKITYNTWLSGQTAFAYVPNFPNFAKTFSYIPVVVATCKQLTTEDCYFSMISYATTTNVGYGSQGKSGYINASTQSLKGTTQSFVFNLIAMGG